MDTSTIREHMKVVGKDRQPVGTVDEMDGDRIKLTKNDAHAGGMHHYIPSDWVERVDEDVVCLSKDAQDAQSEWQSE